MVGTHVFSLTSALNVKRYKVSWSFRKMWGNSLCVISHRCIKFIASWWTQFRFWSNPNLSQSIPIESTSNARIWRGICWNRFNLLEKLESNDEIHPCGQILSTWIWRGIYLCGNIIESCSTIDTWQVRNAHTSQCQAKIFYLFRKRVWID